MPTEAQLLIEAEKRGILTPELQKRRDELPEQAAPLQEDEPTKGLFGLIPEETRGEVREFVEDQPFLARLGIEITPTISGVLAGAKLGARFGPWGLLGGAAIGGLLGEAGAQETGVAERSNLNLALSGAAVPTGRVAVAVTRGVKDLTKGAIKRMPAVRFSIGELAKRGAVGEAESMGAAILAAQRGLLAKSSDELYAAARDAGAKVSSGELSKTREAIILLLDDLQKYADFPTVKAAIATIERHRDILFASGGRFSAVSFREIVDARTLMGAAIALARNQGGVKLGSFKKLFSAFADDIDTLAAKVGKTGEKARIVQVAAQRAKIEFAVTKLRTAIARFTSPVVGKSGETQLNVTALRKWLLDVLNPKHSRFDKNFKSSIGDQITEIDKTLARIEKFIPGTGPAGAGSIVQRGIGARLGAGFVGFLVAGPVGAGFGAMFGAQGPELVVAALMSPKGRKLLERLIREGKGFLDNKAIATLSQFVVQMLIKPSETSRALRTKPLENK